MKIGLKKSTVLLLCGTAISGCTTADPTVYSGLTSAQHLQPNPQDKSGRVPFRYSSNADWRLYSKVIVDPVTIYRGPDNQFENLSDQDKAALASYMQAQFTAKLGSRFTIANVPTPGTLRLHLTLTGAKTTTPVLGPFSHLDVGGGVYNIVQSARDKEGSLTGSVAYAVEIFDASSNRLLAAYVTKQYPDALNAGASFGALQASNLGIENGADALVAQLK